MSTPISVSEPEPSRPPMGVALEWVARITAVALVMFLPGVAGQWLDGRWGTRFFGPAGFVFGLIAGVTCLLAMTRSQKR